MLSEEKSSSSSSSSFSSTLIVHLFVVGFHHKKGHQIEYSYPLLSEPHDDQWSNIASLALPDGAHNRDKDLIYFHIPSNTKQTLFGIAAYRQIDAHSLINKDADVTRNSIQKSVCLILRQPLYGNVSEELELITEKYFEGKDFNKTDLFQEFVDNINKNPPEFDLKYFSARDLVKQYRRKTLILFKLILLQKKVLFMLSPIENLVKTILTLVSLIPELICNGLNECTLIGEKSNIETLINLHENEDIVFDRNDEKQQIDFDNIKLKTIKIDEDDISTTSNDIQQEQEQDTTKTNIIKRATSITSKLTDTFNRLTTTPTTATTTTNTSNIILNYSVDLTHLDQFHFPIQLFNQNNLLHPYLSLNNLDLLNNSNVNSYVIGASNGLFRQQNNIDIIINDQDEDFLIQSTLLKSQLQLTTADLRFTQLFEDSDNGIKSEEEIRRLFLNYFLSLLAVAQTPNDEAMNDFNSTFVQSFQMTEAFRLWQLKGPYPHFDQIIPRHPQAGQLNVTDVKLRVSHVLDDTETGRKLKGAFEDTSQFMGEKSRAATKVLGQAKNSLFSSVIGTINHGKQWLAKPPQSPSEQE
ncbi:unnamed protein product [Adineta steineri]|uniref:UDENN domain-containing protein n=1 Tax=Adineta steineri TaxID=433720 RepID=A0A814W269_9BILA|nr:unnamed protein product [Adineta steineri]